MIKKIAFLCLFTLLSLTSTAATWTPPGNIKIVVAYPPGGSTDKWARVVSKILADHGWTNYVENKPGGETVIASNYVAQSKPDGTTLQLGTFGFLDANLASKTPPEGIEYTEHSFTDIVPLGSGSLVLAVANNVPVSNYQEFKEYVRKNPNEFNLGFFSQRIGEAFKLWAHKEGLPQPKIVLYKGSTPLDADLAGGHVQFAFDTYNTIAPLQQSGKVKVIAVLDNSGYDLVKKANPNITLYNIAKSHPDLAIPIFYGVFAPAGLPKEAVAEINTVINLGLKDPKYTAEMTNLYITVKGGTPTDLTKSHQELYKLFKNVSLESE